MAKFITQMEHTEEGAKLTLTEEQEKNCRIVYRRSENKPEHYVFAGLWNPETEYPDDHVIVPLRSTYEGLSKPYDAGTVFVNVIGSHNDELPQGTSSWIDIIKDNLPDNYDCSICCAVRNKRFKKENGVEQEIEMCCTGNGKAVVGGHVIMDTIYPDTVAEWGKVCLLPICKAHNTGPGHGGGYYMRLEREMQAVVLQNYLHASKIEAALAANV